MVKQCLRCGLGSLKVSLDYYAIYYEKLLEAYTAIQTPIVSILICMILIGVCVASYLITNIIFGSFQKLLGIINNAHNKRSVVLILNFQEWVTTLDPKILWVTKIPSALCKSTWYHKGTEINSKVVFWKVYCHKTVKQITVRWLITWEVVKLSLDVRDDHF